MTASSTTSKTPTTLIVFGATGDLMRKKIVPALRALHAKKMLPHNFGVVAFARRPLTTEQFRASLGDDESFTALFRYHRGAFDDHRAYRALAKEKTNFIFFLAVPPEHYAPIVRHLGGAGISGRLLIEKPFGNDRKSARALNTLLKQFFTEKDIYRMDHYLAKDMVQKLFTFRFAKGTHEKQWSAKHIARMEFSLLETIDVTGRGAFYDRVGAWHDVGQNHILQMLAVATMEKPKMNTAHAVRHARATLLRALSIPTATEVRHNTDRAQYAGYRNTEGVAPDSHTETYFKITAYLNTPRWRGVPFVLEGGKKQKQTKKEIAVFFTDGSAVRLRSTPPKTGQYTAEYAALLSAAISGDQTLFVSSAETDAEWRFADAISASWRALGAPRIV